MTPRELIESKFKYCGIEVGKVYNGYKVRAISHEGDEHSPLIIRYAPENAPDENKDCERQCADYYFREHFKNRKNR